MGKPKFTPGPWTIERYYPYREKYPIQIRKVYEGKAFRNELICSIPYRVTLQKKEKSEANASLISAAPDLYKALKDACYELCHQNGCADDLKCDYWDSDKEVCTNADGECFVQNWLALLALARGEKAPKNNTKNTNNMKNKEIH